MEQIGKAEACRVVLFFFKRDPLNSVARKFVHLKKYNLDLAGVQKIKQDKYGI